MRLAVAALALMLSACTLVQVHGQGSDQESAPATIIPFDMSSGRPVVQAMVNGRGPYPFIFDTGAPDLTVFSPLAAELALDVVGQTEVSSPLAGTPVSADLMRVESLSLGSASLSSIDATVFVIEGLPPEAGMGVIGPAMFRESGRVTLDYGTNTILIGGDIDAAGIAIWSPVGEYFAATLHLGGFEIPTHIDSGSPGVLSVPVAYESQLPLTGPARVIGRVGTVDAQFEIRSAPIDATARIGDVEIPLTAIQFIPSPFANLGSGALSRGLRLDIDFANNRFALTQGNSTAGSPSPQRVVRRVVGGGPSFGLSAEPPGPDGSMLVHGIESGSPAEVIGLRTGDRIVVINGASPGELGMSGVRAAFSAETLTLTVRRGDADVILSR